MTKRKQQICRAESKREREGGEDPGPSSGEAAGCTRVHAKKFLCDLVSLLCGFGAFHDLQGLVTHLESILQSSLLLTKDSLESGNTASVHTPELRLHSAAPLYVGQEIHLVRYDQHLST